LDAAREVQVSKEVLDVRAQAAGYKNYASMEESFRRETAVVKALEADLRVQNPSWTAEQLEREASILRTMELTRRQFLTTTAYVTDHGRVVGEYTPPNSALMQTVAGFNNAVLDVSGGKVGPMYENLPGYAKVAGHFEGETWREDGIMVIEGGRQHRFKDVVRMKFEPSRGQNGKHLFSITRRGPGSDEKTDVLEVSDHLPPFAE
jgi:hypothetical protein